MLLFPAAPFRALDVTVDELRQNVSQNMEGCAVVRRTPNKKKEQSVYLQRCLQQHAKRVDFLKHLSITASLEAVPLTKDVMYPSAVSSQLCKYKSEEVEQFSAAQLFSMTEEVVMDLQAAASEHAQVTPSKPSKKRKRTDEMN